MSNVCFRQKRGNDEQIVQNPASFLDVHHKLTHVGSMRPISDVTDSFDKVFQPHPECQGSPNAIAAYSGPLEDYGLIGLRKFRPSWPLVNMFRRTHCGGVFRVVNNSWLIDQNILFQPWGKIVWVLKFKDEIATLKSVYIYSRLGRFELLQ